MRIGFLVVALAVAGCSASGVKVDPATVASFKPGQTTAAQVVAALGAPSYDVALGDGSRMMAYSYAQMSVRPETFIPIVGAFAGGADSRSSTVTLRFKPDGTLADTTSSTVTMGSANGQPVTAPTNQPRTP